MSRGIGGHHSALKETKKCTICFEVKKINNFSICAISRPYPRSVCKRCRSKISSLENLERKIKKNPILYLRCCKCSTIFHKRHVLCLKCENEKNKDLIV